MSLIDKSERHWKKVERFFFVVRMCVCLWVCMKNRLLKIFNAENSRILDRAPFRLMETPTEKKRRKNVF